MNNRFIFNRFGRHSCVQFGLLIALWGAGLILGIFLYTYFLQFVQIDFARFIFAECRTIAFLSVGIPIAVTAFSVSCNWYMFNCLSFLIEAIARGFCAAVIFRTAGYAAWLLRGALLFTGIGTSVVMWWLFLRQQQATIASAVRTVIISTGLICSFNFFVISPFINSLSIHF